MSRTKAYWSLRLGAAAVLGHASGPGTQNLYRSNFTCGSVVISDFYAKLDQLDELKKQAEETM